MFKRIFQGSTKSTNTHQLSLVLMNLASTENPTEKQRIIETHPELLSSEANELLNQILAKEEDQEVAQRMASSKDLLNFCREVGLEKAFNAVNRTNHMNRVVREVVNLMNDKHYQQCTKLLQKEIQKISFRTHPLEWSLFHFHLGKSLFFTYGTQSEKTEEIIETYQQVLGISTPGNLHARLQAMHSLAFLYPLRAEGNRAENIERSINICHEILSMISPESNFNLWFRTKAQLAQRYSERVRGNRKENLDQVISLYNEMPVQFSERIPWKNALEELAGIHIFHSAQTVHKQSMMKFIHAQTWSEAKRILDETPELLSDEIDSLLNQMTEQTLDEYWASIYKEYLALLRRCRLAGAETAFYEKQGDSIDPDLLSQIIMAPVTTIYSMVEENPGFLTDSTFQLLETKIETLQKGEDLNSYYMIMARLQGIYNLLRRCREIGTDEAFAERMLDENPFPLPEDAPKELKEAQERIAKLASIGYLP